MTAFARRLPHVLTRSDLALLLAPTYAEALSVDEEEAHERLVRALAEPDVLADLYRGLEAALHEARGVRQSQDALLDKVSAGVAARRSRAKAAPTSPSVSAVIVRLNLAIGLAPEQMRGMLTSEKGRALLDAGLHALGAHLVKELLR